MADEKTATTKTMSQDDYQIIGATEEVIAHPKVREAIRQHNEDGAADSATAVSRGGGGHPSARVSWRDKYGFDLRPIGLMFQAHMAIVFRLFGTKQSALRDDDGAIVEGKFVSIPDCNEEFLGFLVIYLRGAPVEHIAETLDVAEKRGKYYVVGRVEKWFADTNIGNAGVEEAMTDIALSLGLAKKIAPREEETEAGVIKKNQAPGSSPSPTSSSTNTAG